MSSPLDEVARQAGEWLRGIGPLRDTGKLGALLIDFPPWFVPSSDNRAYLRRARELFPGDWRHKLRFLPLILATGIGLTITNTCAVLEALFGMQSEFVRTPKYRIGERLAGGKEHFFRNVYRHRTRWVAMVEILIGTYFAFAVRYALGNENYGTAGFLCLFVVGYLGTGLFSIFQAKWDRMADGLSGYVAALLRPFFKGLQES